MKLMREWPIRKKMMFIILAIASTSMFLFGIIFAFIEINLVRNSAVDNVLVLAEAVAKNSIGAISFEDREMGAEVLNTLNAESDIVNAVIFDPDGTPFAYYFKKDIIPAKIQPFDLTYSHNFVWENGKPFLNISYPIKFDNNLIAILQIRSNLAKAQNQLIYLGFALVLNFGFVLILAFVASTKLQELIIKPLLTLTHSIREISLKGDYSIIVKSTTRDEIGQLVDDFNAMLKLIHERTNELRSKHKEALAMEKELRMAQKLEAVGQLAAGVAHEINTPAQYVHDNIEFLQEGFSEVVKINTAYRNVLDTTQLDAITPERIEQVHAAAEAADMDYLIEEIPNAITEGGQGIKQIAKIVNAMKAFSHPGGDAKEPVDLNSLIENSITITRNEWKFVADMVTHLDDSIPKVICDAQVIGQVLLNLIINAAHAISELKNKNSGDRGTVTISTRQIKDQVQIRIADTGPGIPDSIREKVFDPFFTTKSIGKGTGQGLAIARKAIVESHGGTLDFDTVRGKGTTFTINLYIEGIVSEEGIAAA